MNRPYNYLAALLMTAMIFLPPPLLAAQEEDWPSIFPAKPQVRLITAQTAIGSGTIEAGVHIRLGPKWKTYAQNPGKTGIAPKFDWSRSRNLKSAEVRFPRAARIAVFGGEIIGYQNEIVFPVRVEAAASDRPLLLRLELSYAICDDLCVPLKEQFSLTLPPGTGRLSAEAALLRRFIDKVPQ